MIFAALSVAIVPLICLAHLRAVGAQGDDFFRLMMLSSLFSGGGFGGGGGGGGGGFGGHNGGMVTGFEQDPTLSARSGGGGSGGGASPGGLFGGLMGLLSRGPAGSGGTALGTDHTVSELH